MPDSTLAMIFVDLALIMAAAKLLGRLAVVFGQPPVVGEIAAGILAGPAILGTQLSHTVFPAEARPALAVLADLGVAAFMFTAGLELDRGVFTRTRTVVCAVSISAYLLPLAAGCVLAVLALDRHRPGAPVSRAGFALFVGCALAVTAFPVLARILHDRNLIHTRTGQLSLGCAALIDLLAWAGLAIVLALAAPPAQHWRWALLAPAAGIIWWIGRPMLARLAQGRGEQTVIGLGLAAALLGGALTEWIGLHLIFGAFAAGVIFPRAHRRTAESGARVLATALLPAFFVIAGLSVDLTGVDLTGAGELLVIVAVAVAAKMGAVLAAGRLTGLTARTAATLAVLLNTRGLTELVILHLGLSAGLLGPDLYSLLVLMALVTTAMTEPLLRRLGAAAPPPSDPDTVAESPTPVTGDRDG
ncbi:cation:proton antiporter [Nocardia sp. NPDC048505]|uniref:cation:proton antiporter n=1 Tax=Nocardia sp. NPDC048505 TaxID=3155756 RepID=UPI0033C9F6FC